MNPTQLFSNVLAEIQSWLVTARATIATYQTLFIIRWQARWAAIKAWFVRKKKVIFWSIVVLVTAVLASVLLVYLYRRSDVVRATLDNLIGNAIGLPGKLWGRLRSWAQRETPPPVKAMAGPPDDEPLVVADRGEPIPAMPGQDGPLPAEMKL